MDGVTGPDGWRAENGGALIVVLFGMQKHIGRPKQGNDHTLNISISDDQRLALHLIKDRDGIPIREQIRRGIQMYIDSKNVTLPKRGGKHAAA